MQRNQSKRFVLQAVQDLREPVESGLVQVWLSTNYNIESSDKAVSMALLRCHRQGLLSRRNGKYQLSPKGSQRLPYLLSSST